VFNGRSTRCCISCAKTHDTEWHAAYVAATRCEQCKEQKYVSQLYDGRSTRFCVSCAKTHDPEWYAAYVAASRCRKPHENESVLPARELGGRKAVRRMVNQIDHYGKCGSTAELGALKGLLPVPPNAAAETAALPARPGEQRAAAGVRGDGDVCVWLASSGGVCVA
jgi:hypothetical protein